MYIETNARTLSKSLSWRVTATATTAILVLIFTGRLDAALAIGGIEALAKMVLYYGHERIWNKINLGRRELEPAVFWLTGLSGAGKKEIAEQMKQVLEKKKLKVEVLDGDGIRKFFPSVGFSRQERELHVKRVSYLASQLEKHGVIVVVSMTSPFIEGRDFARRVCKRFVEIHVSTPASFCEERDPKGLWKEARAGKISDFVGVDLPYEPPANPEFSFDFAAEPPSEGAGRIIKNFY